MTSYLAGFSRGGPGKLWGITFAFLAVIVFGSDATSRGRFKDHRNLADSVPEATAGCKAGNTIDCALLLLKRTSWIESDMESRHVMKAYLEAGAPDRIRALGKVYWESTGAAEALSLLAAGKAEKAIRELDRIGDPEEATKARALLMFTMAKSGPFDPVIRMLDEEKAKGKISRYPSLLAAQFTIEGLCKNGRARDAERLTREWLALADAAKLSDMQIWLASAFVDCKTVSSVDLFFSRFKSPYNRLAHSNRVALETAIELGQTKLVLDALENWCGSSKAYSENDCGYYLDTAVTALAIKGELDVAQKLSGWILEKKGTTHLGDIAIGMYLHGRPKQAEKILSNLARTQLMVARFTHWGPVEQARRLAVELPKTHDQVKALVMIARKYVEKGKEVKARECLDDAENIASKAKEFRLLLQFLVKAARLGIGQETGKESLRKMMQDKVIAAYRPYLKKKRTDARWIVIDAAEILNKAGYTQLAMDTVVRVLQPEYNLHIGDLTRYCIKHSQYECALEGLLEFGRVKDVVWHLSMIGGRMGKEGYKPTGKVRELVVKVFNHHNRKKDHLEKP